MRRRMLAGVLLVTGLAIAGWGAVQNISSVSYSRAGTAAKASSVTPRSQVTQPGRCGPGEITSVAIIRPGAQGAALNRLTHPPLARLADPGSGGELAFFSSSLGVPPAGAGSPLSQAAKPVRPDPKLQSCNYLLRDRPAAQPYIAASVTAAVRHGLAASAAVLRAGLEGVLIGDNPLRSGSLVVTLLIQGQRVGTDPMGHAVYGPYRSIFVLLDRTTMRITGAGAGTWPG